MKIEIAEHGRMTESGSSLLRLIQNQDMPLLDLLVRESVQNSLDAVASNCDKVVVDVTVGEFKATDLNRHFEKIENGLNRRYASKGKAKFISVRDSNTVGLTGPVRYSEVKNNDFGHLLKLVYEICKPQSNEGAGGSWGLGKTIYFRLGIGLVIYYSRIYQSGKYQSRLAACLVENENKPGALIPYGSGVKRGIAWWGKKDGLMSNGTIPLDNEAEIEKILHIFGIKPYAKKETGTTIIIPYINETELLNEVYATNEPAENKPYWANSVSEYLKVALQRWYAPRLLNTSYPYGAYLSASVNGERLKVSGMLSVFRYIRELYVLATGTALDENSFLSEQKVEYHVESIDLRGVLEKTSSGRFAYAKFNRMQLQMEPPVNQKTPYQQIENIFVQMENGNGPIVAYTRRPGMIVGYDHDSTWTHRMPKSGPDEYIIGVFAANSLNTLKNIIDAKTGQKMTLEEYIRQGEKADHASWTDRNIGGNNPRIISSIQKHVINKIKRQYTETVKESYERQNVGLGHALANILLPEADFGNTPTQPPLPPDNPGRPSRQRGSRKSAIHIVGEPVYAAGTVTFDVEIHLKKKPCQLSLQVMTDFKRYDADTWESEDEIGKVFPLSFREIQIKKIQKYPRSKDNQYDCDLQVDSSEHLNAQNADVAIAIRKSKVFSTCSYIKIIPADVECVATGKLAFAFNDSGVKGSFELKELDNE